MPNATAPRFTSIGDGLVVGVDVPGGVGAYRRQPRQRGRLAVGLLVGGDDGLEVGLAGRECQLALVLRVGELADRGGSWLAEIRLGL